MSFLPRGRAYLAVSFWGAWSRLWDEAAGWDWGDGGVGCGAAATVVAAKYTKRHADAAIGGRFMVLWEMGCMGIRRVCPRRSAYASAFRLCNGRATLWGCSRGEERSLHFGTAQTAVPSVEITGGGGTAKKRAQKQECLSGLPESHKKARSEERRVGKE